eukprot:gnl/Trimastix_PCT/699.p1 GENE.gnl/Trimastix_PCT/699~~gnl/Trimastix_PCT/699.p1  ORF type:complete len:213 (-),score=16.26 gnl/Trimastix_PCT/699:77-715(-)
MTELTQDFASSFVGTPCAFDSALAPSTNGLWFWQDGDLWISFNMEDNHALESRFSKKDYRQFEMSATHCTNNSLPDDTFFITDVHEKRQISKTSPTLFRKLRRARFDQPILGSPIPVTFVWPYEGKSVVLKGSFNQWGKGVVMRQRHPQDPWTATLLLPPGRFYEYKFIVDGEWMYRLDEPTLNSEGNINNIIRVEFPLVGVEGMIDGEDDR